MEGRIAEAAMAAGDFKAADGEHEEALRLYERSLDVCRRLYGPASGELEAAAAAVEGSAAASAARARVPAQRLVLWRRAG